MNTVLTTDFPVSEKKFKSMLVNEMKTHVTEYIQGFYDLFTEIQEVYKNKYIKMTNGLYYDSDNAVFCQDFNVREIEVIHDFSKFKKDKFLKKNALFTDNESELPKLKWLRKTKKVIEEFFGLDVWIVCECDDERYTKETGLVCLYNAYSNRVSGDSSNIKDNSIYSFSMTTSNREDKVIAFPVVNINLAQFEMDYGKFLNEVCYEYSVCPSDLREDAKLRLADYFKMKAKEYVEFKDGEMRYDSGKIAKALVYGKDEEMFEHLHGNLIEVLRQYIEKKEIGEYEMQSKEELLNCEKKRADIEPYEERLLTDPNRGHWDLWLEGTDAYTVKMNNKYMARNPKCDINKEGVIAIDFGTKSTIVVYQSDIEHSLPMGIGDGNISKQTLKRYENPTVMQFVNLEKFMEAYRSKAGRPDTVWEDLPISHTAMDKFKNSKSEEYYAFLHQIKQWAGQRKKQFRIQPIHGESLLLPAFIDLTEDDINPIEIYAYYIGLYINNMRKGHGIFLDYYLSFPVTYETEICQKIVESFTKGIKKSLPISIQEDEEIMKDFKVNGDISEPTAYAVCALQEYGFEPAEDEEFFYGIFDFGGGTTDFDFGLWKCSQKRRYDYCIENFGAGGDEFLGGENLLEMLAFEIFKENQDVMRENNYTFAMAPKSKEFLGSDALLSDSQEAEKNMHNLMEKLRKYWERPETTALDDEEDSINGVVETIYEKTRTSAYSHEIHEELASIIDKCGNDIKQSKELIQQLIKEYAISLEENDSEDIIIKVSLFDKDGKDHPNVELSTTKKFINDFIEDKIGEGVKNFFSALLLSYQSDKVKKPTTVNIFLAGNSCKSPIVKKVFEEKIVEEEKKIKEKFGLNNVDRLYEIFPPLGTEDAYKKMKERKISFSKNDFEKPTGKTGVAFGLIQCRTGGTIERISNVDSSSEIPFQYFLGWQSRKKFVLFKDDTKFTQGKGKPHYNEWYKFIEADADTFYLYYTTLPECVNGDLLVDGNAGVRRVKCNIDKVDDDAFVYIRAISPHTIQYAVSSDYDVDKNRMGEIYTKELD